jgi:hypothetical protein
MEDANQVVAEHYHLFDNMPVCICVLETVSGFYAVGFSASSKKRFDAEAAQVLAHNNAKITLLRNTRKWSHAT